jgi:hypothetical protein
VPSGYLRAVLEVSQVRRRIVTGDKQARALLDS